MMECVASAGAERANRIALPFKCFINLRKRSIVFSSYGVRESRDVKESEVNSERSEHECIEFAISELTGQPPDKDTSCLVNEIFAQLLVVRIVSKMLVVFDLE